MPLRSCPNAFLALRGGRSFFSTALVLDYLGYVIHGPPGLFQEFRHLIKAL
ncbi:MAG: hypothetical protein WAK96_02540 [Desulfobaccales bacterium]